MILMTKHWTLAPIKWNERSRTELDISVPHFNCTGSGFVEPQQFVEQMYPGHINQEGRAMYVSHQCRWCYEVVLCHKIFSQSWWKTESFIFKVSLLRRTQDRPIMLHGKSEDKLLMKRDTMLWRRTSIRANAVKIIIAIKPSNYPKCFMKINISWCWWYIRREAEKITFFSIDRTHVILQSINSTQQIKHARILMSTKTDMNCNQNSLNLI